MGNTLIKIKRNEFRIIQEALINKEVMKDKLIIPSQHGYQILDIGEIIRCESESNYTTIYMNNNKKYVVSKPLKYIDHKLIHHDFLRSHQSHLVNPIYIAEYVKSDGGYLLMADGSTVSISRNLKKKLNDFFRMMAV